MQAGEATFTKFISGEVTLVIPVYQRNYDWRKENCEQLFNDIVGIITNEKPHFIGTFVYQFAPKIIGAPQEYIIIDGQQRITSIILLAKALYDSTDDADLKNDIRTKFIKHTTGKNIKNKCRLRPNKFDLATFEKLMHDDGLNENNFSEQEKDSALYRNYKFFRDQIATTTLTHEELCDAIDQLNVVIILLKEENPQEIFESLNSTGLDLSKADLIRNFLLMPLNYDLQEELYKKFWLEIEILLRPSNNMENFLEQYLVSKLRSRDAYSTKVSPSSLYFVFKRYFDDNKFTAEACLKDMLRYAKFFRRLIFNEDNKFENLSALDKKFYELVYLLESKNSPIILMYLLDRFEENHFGEENFINFIDALISLTVRAKICGNSGITSQFAGNVLARLDKEDSLTEKYFWQTITFGKGRYAFPNDKDFQDELMRGQLYKARESNFCKYILYSLEKAARAKELPSYSKATIEHILPQKTNDAWKKYLKERNDSQTHEIFLHTLGNLTLTEENSTLGNSDFDSKKKIYSRSNYSYTRALTDYSEWTSKQIQARAKKLATNALKIWTLPEEFSSRLIKLGDTFNLDSDFGILSGTKPVLLFILNKETKTSAWIEVLREIVRQLYALDKDIFRRAIQLENIRKNLFTNEPANFKIDDDFYLNTRTGFDVKYCLRTAKAIVENFDKLGGTNFREDIYFTLKHD